MNYVFFNSVNPSTNPTNIFLTTIESGFDGCSSNYLSNCLSILNIYWLQI